LIERSVSAREARRYVQTHTSIAIVILATSFSLAETD
jgi:hypothetical protein